MLKVLVISSLPWRSDNSFGNTYSNWFSKIKGIELANIYLGEGLPTIDSPAKKFFQISEKAIARSVLKRHVSNNSIGRIVHPVVEEKFEREKDTSFYSKALLLGKRYHPQSLYLIKEAIWKFGNINYDGVYSFIEEFKPDVIFMGLNYLCFLDRFGLKIYEKYKIPIVLEAAIDIYSLKQLSFNPFFWVKRFWVRYKSRQICRVSKLLYVISEEQRIDYSKYFNLPVKVMYKFPDRNRKKFDYSPHNSQLRYLFTGNIGIGRWKSLSILASALKTVGGGYLDIYTPTVLSAKQKRALNIEGVSYVHNPIPQSQVIEEQNNADILVHVESFNLKNKLEVRYSISTKIMDYVSVGRCIFAIGPDDIASINYLKNNKLAVVASSYKEVLDRVKDLNGSPDTIVEYAQNNCSVISSSLNEDKQKTEFFNDLSSIVD